MYPAISTSAAVVEAVSPTECSEPNSGRQKPTDSLPSSTDPSAAKQRPGSGCAPAAAPTPACAPAGGLHDFASCYNRLELLGKGSYSVVYAVRCIRTGVRYAAKFINMRDEGYNPDEAVILQSIAHPNIIALHDIFIDTDAQQCIIVTPEMTSGELYSKVCTGRSVLREPEAAQYVMQLLAAVHHLHGIGVVHRDIKLENVMLGNGDDGQTAACLIDFGFSKRVGIGQRSLNSCCGSPNYLAPEMLRAARAADQALPTRHKHYGCEVDLWAVGVIMYTLLVGRYPFQHERKSKWYTSIMQAAYTFPEPNGPSVSQLAKDLLSHLLDVNVDTRYTSTQALAHPWFEACLGAALCSQVVSQEVAPSSIRNNSRGSSASSTVSSGPKKSAVSSAAAEHSLPKTPTRPAPLSLYPADGLVGVDGEAIDPLSTPDVFTPPNTKIDFNAVIHSGSRQ